MWQSPPRMLLPFFALSFGLTWGLALLLVLFPDALESLFGPVSYTNPLFVLAVYAPAIAALVLIARHHGIRGIGRFLRRFTLWRMPLVWWAFLMFGIPAAFYLGAALKGSLAEPLPYSPWQRLLPAMLTALLVGPVEELGWRGLALPLLQRRMAPLWAGLLLGAIWATWHIPAFLVGGTPQSAWSFPAFFVGVVALSVIMTPMFNASGGSLIVAALFHFQTNGPAWPDAQPWDTAVFVAIALMVVWLNRHSMLSREGAVVEILTAHSETIPTSGRLPRS